MQETEESKYIHVTVNGFLKTSYYILLDQSKKIQRVYLCSLYSSGCSTLRCSLKLYLLVIFLKHKGTGQNNCSFLAWILSACRLTFLWVLEPYPQITQYQIASPSSPIPRVICSSKPGSRRNKKILQILGLKSCINKKVSTKRQKLTSSVGAESKYPRWLFIVLQVS